MYPHQHERLTEAIASAGVEAFVATSPANVAYVSGYRGGAECDVRSRPLAVFSASGTALIVPSFDVPAVLDASVGVDHVVAFGELAADLSGAGLGAKQLREIVAEAPRDSVRALVTALRRLDLQGRIGIDESGIDAALWRDLNEQWSEGGVPAGRHLGEARRVKGPYELECLGHALRVAEEALDAVIQVVDRGVTERDAAAQYATEVIKRGGWPLPPIVAIGDRTWIGTPRPGDRALHSGELIRFDVGCMYNGYWGTVARTAVLGEPARGVDIAYQAIEAGLEAGLDGLRSGKLAARVVDGIVGMIRAAGLEGYERGADGHGIGLDVREAPALASGQAGTLEAGEVLQLSVGYCEAYSMGMSIRDTALVTGGGSRPLNRSRRGLIVLD